MVGSSIIKAILLILTYFFVSFAAFQGGLYGPMIYDSQGRLAASGPALESQGLKGALAIYPERPVVLATFYLNFLMDGIVPEYYRLMNIFLLAITGSILALLLVQILSLPTIWPEVGPTDKKIVGVVFGLLFVLHPIQLYVTLYIWQRFALMACLFSYGSIATYIAVRKRTIPQLTGYALCFCLFACGLASKENAVVTPLVFLLAEIILFRSSVRDFLVRAVAYGCLIITCLFLLSLWKAQFSAGGQSAGFLDVLRMNYLSAGLAVEEVLLTQARVFFRYLYITLLPTQSNSQLIMPQIISESLFQPLTTILAVIAVLCLAVTTVWLIHRRPLVSFGIAVYVIAVLPESLLVPNYAYFGYRAIFPMLGLFIAVADPVLGFLRALSNSRWTYLGRGALFAAAVGACLFLVSVDGQKAQAWSNPVSWWKDTVGAIPQASGKIEKKILSETLSNLGDAYMRCGIPAKAVEPLQRAVAANPSNYIAHYNLGSAFNELGEFMGAEIQLQEAARLAPDNVFVRRLLLHVREKNASGAPMK